MLELALITSAFKHLQAFCTALYTNVRLTFVKRSDATTNFFLLNIEQEFTEDPVEPVPGGPQLQDRFAIVQAKSYRRAPQTNLSACFDVCPTIKQLTEYNGRSGTFSDLGILQSCKINVG